MGEALAAMSVVEFDLLLCQLPFSGIDDLLGVAREKHGARTTMVMRQKNTDREGSSADHWPVKPARWDILDRMKVLVVRKRGPARGFLARREELCAR
jgi:hypothetical protein